MYVKDEMDMSLSTRISTTLLFIVLLAVLGLVYEVVNGNLEQSTFLLTIGILTGLAWWWFDKKEKQAGKSLNRHTIERLLHSLLRGLQEGDDRAAMLEHHIYALQAEDPETTRAYLGSLSESLQYKLMLTCETLLVDNLRRQDKSNSPSSLESASRVTSLRAQGAKLRALLDIFRQIQR